MFSFEPLDKCLYNGYSPDNISKYVEQRFVLHFGSPELDNRFYVVLKEENIRFFFYDLPICPNPKNTIKRDNFKEIGCISLTHPKETGNDILHFPQMPSGKLKYRPPEKEINDTLASFKSLFYGFPFWNEDNLRCLMKCCFLIFVFEIEDREEKFSYSPLYDTVRSKLRKSDVYRLLSAKIQYTLYVPKDGLVFNSNEYSYKARKFADRLMDKQINKVISPHDYPLKNKNEATHEGNQANPTDVASSDSSTKVNLTNSSADTNQGTDTPDSPVKVNLSDSNASTNQHAGSPDSSVTINNKCKKTQSWLYNPEEELEALLEQNRRQVASTDAQDIVLENALELKIRDYFYTKHAVYQAITSSLGKYLFWLGQILMAVTSLSILAAFLRLSWFDCIIKTVFPALVASISFCGVLFFIYYFIGLLRKKKIDLLFSLLIIITLLASLIFSLIVLVTGNCHLWMFLSVIISILIAILCSGYYNNAGSHGWGSAIYALFPRIIVAELAAWLTIGIAEDLVKSMLWGSAWNTVLYAIIAVLFIIGMIIGGEVKQHSPYLTFRKNVLQRILPILNHSLFFALTIGILIQIIFYDNLIKNSGVMSNVVFNTYFDKADYYCQNLIDLDKAIRQYDDYCITTDLKNISITGSGVGKQITVIPDTVGRSTTVESTIKLNHQFKSQIPVDTSNSHNLYIQHINRIIIELDSLNSDVGIRTSFLKDSLQELTVNDLTESQKERCIKHNRGILDPLLLFIQKELTIVRQSTIKYNNYETLMNWATAGDTSSVDATSTYLYGLTQKYKNSDLPDNDISNHKCSRIIHYNDKDKPIRVFPILLIFHTLVVLVIAFVTQLIISDKSVTETL